MMPSVTSTIGNWPAVIVLVLFAISNAAVIYPIRLPIPRAIQRGVLELLVVCRVLVAPSHPLRRAYVHLNFTTVPLVSVLLLLITRAIDGKVVREGIIGANGIKPLNIMALFISLAYLSISLDATGLFQFLALWVVHRGGSSGPKLFLYLYVFFLVCGVIVGNDPVILSGTAFLAYLTRVSGIASPTAWIFAQFAAANMASVVLVSSNPTNLVLSGAFSLTFVTYTAHCILPFLAAAILVYFVLIFGLFRSSDLIPPSLNVSLEANDDINSTLVDKKGAIFGSILILITLGVLVGTSAIGVPVWEVTVPPAVIMLLRDLHHDWSRHRQLCMEKLQSAPTSPNLSDENHDPMHEPGVELQQLPSRERQSTPTIAPRRTLLSTLSHYLRFVSVPFPTVVTIIGRLPFALLPFAFLMFILVQALTTKGWVEIFARWWAAWISKTGTLGAIGGMGFLACLACNVCGTNIGATILLARVIQLWISNSTDAIDPHTRDGAIYALALGSNYGAFTLTFSASLAGLLWRRILLQKGIHVRALQFLLINLPIAFTAMTVSSLILVAQVSVVHY